MTLALLIAAYSVAGGELSFSWLAVIPLPFLLLISHSNSPKSYFEVTRAFTDSPFFPLTFRYLTLHVWRNSVLHVSWSASEQWTLQTLLRKKLILRRPPYRSMEGSQWLSRHCRFCHLSLTRIRPTVSDLSLEDRSRSADFANGIRLQCGRDCCSSWCLLYSSYLLQELGESILSCIKCFVPDIGVVLVSLNHDFSTWLLFVYLLSRSLLCHWRDIDMIDQANVIWECNHGGQLYNETLAAIPDYQGDGTSAIPTGFCRYVRRFNSN